jgi:membrane protease YdiL (CAAX protease family)
MNAATWAPIAHTPAAIALTVAIAVLYPLFGWYRFRRLEARPDPVPRAVKLRLYMSVVVSQWTLVALCILVLARHGHGLAVLGHGPGVSGVRTALVSLALLAGFAILSRFTLPQLAKASAGELPAHVAKAGRILPRDNVERASFLTVALTAGICEEILYRGWLPWVIAGWTGSATLGFIVAALVFGAGHAYQGRNGVLLTALLGLFLGSVVEWTRSLLPGQLLHIAVDLVNGLAVGATLERHAAQAAAARVDAASAESLESRA